MPRQSDIRPLSSSRKAGSAEKKLSARISQKGVVTVRAGKWWFINDLKASGAQASEEEEAADDPTKEQSTASMFTQEGGSQWNRLNV